MITSIEHTWSVVVNVFVILVEMHCRFRYDAGQSVFTSLDREHLSPNRGPRLQPHQLQGVGRREGICEPV